MKLQVLVAWVVVAVAACGAENPKTEPARVLQVGLEPHVLLLPNGVKAILVPDPHADLASVLVRYQVGTIDDPPSQSGVSHLAAHLVYSQRVGKRTLWAELDRIGTWINTMPTDNHTDFVIGVPPRALVDVMRLEAQRLGRGCAGTTDDDLVRERTNFANELANRPAWLINRSIAHELYPTTNPYYQSSDADPTGVTALGRDQVCAFIESHYVPSNATIVVSGPITPDQFRQIAETTVGAVPARAAARRPAIADLPTNGSHGSITAGVATPSLLVAWPFPADRGARALMEFALDTLATSIKCAFYSDDNYAILWFPTNPNGLDATLDGVRAALRKSLVGADFERERTRRITTLLQQLDASSSRLTTVATAVDLAAPFQALERVTQQGFDTFVTTNLDLARARVLEVAPDGTRPRWHPVGLTDPPHNLRGTIVESSDRSPEVPLMIGPSATLHGARTFTLGNGMHVILMPTTNVPIADIHLVFDSGVTAQPAEHRGTADVAIRALQAIAQRGPHAADASWTFGLASASASFDSSEIDIRGPAMYLDLLMDQFEGLSHTSFTDADLVEGRRRIVEFVGKAHRDVDEVATMRAAIFGSAHPYSRSFAPDATDLNFDAHEVRTHLEQHLQPTNATLIATGGFDLDVMTKLVHDTFDGWHGRGQAATVQPGVNAPAMFAAADQSTRVTVKIGWPAGMPDAKTPDRVVLANMLNIVSYSVGATLAEYRQGDFYAISGAFEPSGAPSAIREIHDRLREIGRGSAFDREVFRGALRRGSLARIAGPWSSDGWARRLAYAVTMGHDIAWLEANDARYARLTYEDIATLAKSELGLDRASWFISGPREAVTAVYAELGVTPVWKN